MKEKYRNKKYLYNNIRIMANFFKINYKKFYL